MSKLKLLQDVFQDYLLIHDDAAKNLILADDDDFINERLAIYGDAYHMRLTEFLQDDYPGLFALVGENLFEEICLEYINQFPSRCYSARYFGQKLEGFLAEFKPYSERPELAEMARFEWALADTIYAADSNYLSLDDLMKIDQQDWPQMRFKAHPSLVVFELKTDVIPIWEAREEGSQVDEVKKNEAPLNWIVWRKPDFISYYRSLSEEQGMLLGDLIDGKNFAEICDNLCEHIPADDVATFAVNTIVSWLNDQVLAEISI